MTALTMLLVVYVIALILEPKGTLAITALVVTVMLYSAVGCLALIAAGGITALIWLLETWEKARSRFWLWIHRVPR